jgi:transcriptional regulator with XRE-family HTH domain
MSMSKAEREALEAAGFAVGDYGDFLELSEEERQLIELRFQLSNQIRQRREHAKMTQSDLAALIKSTQPRVAKIEIAARGVSLDQLFRTYFAVGGETKQLFVVAGMKKSTTLGVPSIKKSRPAAKPAKVSTRKKPVGA